MKVQEHSLLKLVSLLINMEFRIAAGQEYFLKFYMGVEKLITFWELASSIKIGRNEDRWLRKPNFCSGFYLKFLTVKGF